MGNAPYNLSNSQSSTFAYNESLPPGFVPLDTNDQTQDETLLYGRYYGKPAVCEVIYDSELRWYNTLRNWSHCIELCYVSGPVTERGYLIIVPDYPKAGIDRRVFDVLRQLYKRRIVHNRFNGSHIRWNPISNRIVLLFSHVTWSVPDGDVIPYTDIMQVLDIMHRNNQDDNDILSQLKWYARIHHEAYCIRSGDLMDLVCRDDMKTVKFQWKCVLPQRILLLKGCYESVPSLGHRHRVFPNEAFDSPSTFDFISFASRLLFNQESKFDIMLKSVDETMPMSEDIH